MMKTLNEYIDESLLDDEDKVMARGHSAAVQGLIKKMKDYKFPKSNNRHDRHGREIHIGDIVLYGNNEVLEAGVVTKFFDDYPHWAEVNGSEGDHKHIYCDGSLIIPEKLFIKLFDKI